MSDIGLNKAPTDHHYHLFAHRKSAGEKQAKRAVKAAVKALQGLRGKERRLVTQAVQYSTRLTAN